METNNLKPSKELVLAIWDRDYSWINNVDPTVNVIKYNKNINTLKTSETLLQPNVGRDVHTFFWHIVNKYHNLADYTFFAQDYVADHVSNYAEIINDDVEKLSSYAIQDLGGCWFFQTTIPHIITCDTNGNPDHPGLPINEIWNQLFDKSIPDILRFTAAGHFCISRDHVHSKPIEFYQNILKILETNEMSPWCIERLEPYIFEKENDEVIVITSHADTIEKKNMLRSCISEIKNQGYDIILSSHISLDDDIVNSVNFFVLDKDNPIVTFKEYDKYNVSPLFLWYNQEKFKFNISLDLNHGFAVLKLIKNATAIADMNNYKKIHIMDYDYLIEDSSVLKSHSKFLNNYDVVSYNWESRKDIISSGFFSIKTSFSMRCSKKINNLQEYFKFHHISIFEELLFVLFNDGKIKHVSDINDLREKNKVDQNYVSVKMPIKKTGENIILFLTHENSHPGEIFLLLMLFDESDVELKIEVNNNIHDIILPKFQSFLIKIEKEWLDNGIKITIPSYNYQDNYNTNKNIGSCNAEPDIIYSFDEFLNICKI